MSTRLFLSITVAATVLVGATAAFALVSAINPPDFALMKRSVEVPIKLANGTKSTRKVGPAAPGWVPISAISDNLLMAVISSEDTSFYSHKGVDYHEVKEAIRKDIKEKRWARGASTLTQQVIKNVFLTPEKSLIRKAKEILWAPKMEKVLTKSEILCFYVNMVEWGPGIYGIGNASQYYFGVPPVSLTPRQSAFLAMLLPSPVKYHAYFARKQLTKWATRRVNQILNVMKSMGYLDEAAYAAARADALWGEIPDTGVAGAEPPSGDDAELENFSQTPPLVKPDTPPPPGAEIPSPVELPSPTTVPMESEPGSGTAPAPDVIPE